MEKEKGVFAEALIFWRLVMAVLWLRAKRERATTHFCKQKARKYVLQYKKQCFFCVFW
ncbi:MAG: hypothetical protein SPH43_01230 [Candidatus Enteromonas sp.]|nr:hypothetical protein [Candidatus Enteromonas sp.]